MGVPMAYSAGFSPHPKISYAGAASMGAASEAEYLEISVTQKLSPTWLRAALDEAMPPGLDIVEIVEAGPWTLADELQASEWSIELPGVSTAAASLAVEAFLASEEIIVERMTKSGKRSFDARGAVLRLAADLHESPDQGPCAILRLVVRHETPAVRPDDVLTALRVVASLTPPVPAKVTRLAQGPLVKESGAVADPLAADRARDGDAAGA
jgi:radical SAM-linked protein